METVLDAVTRHPIGFVMLWAAIYSVVNRVCDSVEVKMTASRATSVVTSVVKAINESKVPGDVPRGTPADRT